MTWEVKSVISVARVKDMQVEVQNWRELLRELTNSPRERQHIAHELGVTPITITRWINNEADPRPQNLRHLIAIFPEYRDFLYDSIEAEFPNIAETEVIEDTARDIPSAFYARIFNSYTTTIESLRFWSICNLILQEALGQLDPDRLGLAITVVRCFVSSRSKQVRSLYETVAQGTFPWSTNMEQKGMYLGAESLAGYCVSTARPQVIQNLKDESNPLPAHQTDHEVSAATHPIMFSGRIAGCILISSTQPNYFLSQSHLTLIGKYANLLALALDPDDFHKQEEIALLPMPLHTIQARYFAEFRNRVTDAMLKFHTGNTQAEQFVREELEEQLLQLRANAE